MRTTHFVCARSVLIIAIRIHPEIAQDSIELYNLAFGKEVASLEVSSGHPRDASEVKYSTCRLREISSLTRAVAIWSRANRT